MKRKRVLYVEDNDDNVYVLRRRLERLGFEVLVAGDGLEGLSMARELAPDLVIMDLVLPRLNGWEAARRLKADPSTAAIPVLALSSSTMPEDRRRAEEVGFDAFDSKPVEFERLKATIDRLLGDRGSS